MEKSVSSIIPKPISIAIDTIFFQMSYSGITRVWEILFKNFLENKDNKYYQITILQRGNGNSNAYKFKPELNIENKFNVLKINEFNYLTMNQDVDYLNHLCKIEGFDIFISTYYTYCTVIPNILLIHDMIPEVFKLAPNHMWKQKDKAILNASSFITISKTTQTDLIKFYPHIGNGNGNGNGILDNYPVEIIYNSVSNNLIYDDNFLKQFGIVPKSYIFAIATNNEEYKNIKLIKSLSTNYGKQLSTLLNNPISIILICKENIPNGFKVEMNILYLSHVKDSILNSIYKNALCFVCPSLYEGFGLPIFEAFSHLTPVIAIKLPIFIELGGGGINFIENNAKSLYEKIEFIYKNDGFSVSNRVDFGSKQVAKFTEESQIAKWHNYFINIRSSLLKPKPFINLIIQTYKETNPERLKELEYCICRNLENPYVKNIHDFGNSINNVDTIIDNIMDNKNYFNKYIKVDNPDNKWLTYDMAFKYANNKYMDFGNYWCIINLDIFLDTNSNWNMTKGKLNDGYIYAQSRHEFNILGNGNGSIDTNNTKMDSNFAKMMHAHTQDAWLFKTPINIQDVNRDVNRDINYDCNFEIGYLGCDNAIADRLVKYGYKLINQPETYKIFHYDIAKGKTSINFMDKHKHETIALEQKKTKPKNKYPERIGSYLVPNYDQLLKLGKGQDIDFNSIIHSLGGFSNLEKYEFISKIMSDRIVMSNP